MYVYMYIVYVCIFYEKYVLLKRPLLNNVIWVFVVLQSPLVEGGISV